MFKIKSLLYMSLIVLLSNCREKDENAYIKFNIIEPGAGIYEIVEKDVNESVLENKSYEKNYYENDHIVKIERYDIMGKLTDDLSTSAVTEFDYDKDGHVKYVMYFDKEGGRAESRLFGYWSIEYIYDEYDRVVMEIYRDKNNKFLKIPTDNFGNYAKKDFLSPVLTYEYLGDKLKIKALDGKFNLLKEVLGDKPCVPFIDCGNSD